MDLKMMLIVHKDKPAVERFAQAVLAEGIAGLTLMPSAGRGRTQGENYDEFRFSFTHIFESREIPNTTIFSILPESHIPRMLELLEEHLPGMDDRGTGLYAVLNVERAGGLS